MKLILTMFLMLFSSNFALADGVNMNFSAEKDSSSIMSVEAQAPHGREFLGCMDTEHECEHAAHDIGYYNHGLRYNDFRCHHDHHYNGCYAW